MFRISYVLGFIFVAGSVVEASGKLLWNVEGDGYWNLDANWTRVPVSGGEDSPASFPNDTDSVAIFEPSVPIVVSLGFQTQDISVGSIVLDSNFPVVIDSGTNPANTLKVANSILKSKAATLTISCPIELLDKVAVESSSLGGGPDNPITFSGPIAYGNVLNLTTGNFIITGTAPSSGLFGVAIGSQPATLLLNMSPGLNAVGGSLSVRRRGRVTLGNANQFGTGLSSTLFLEGILDAGNHPQEFGIFVITETGSILNQESALFTVQQILALSGGTIPGPIALTDSAPLILAVGTQTSVLNGPVNLGSGSVECRVAGSAEPVGLAISNMTGTGTFTKTESGILSLLGTNSIGGMTVEEGTLSVKGTLTSSAPVVVRAGAILGGTGTINGTSIDISGTLSPGSSIGTITLVGPVTFEAGSTFAVEISPTASDLAIITGALTIEPGSTLALSPEFGIYSSTVSYSILEPSGGITGTFSSITSSLPLFAFSFDVTGSGITITGGFLPFSNLVTKGNAGQASKALSSLNNIVCGNLQDVVATLRFIPTVSGLKKALSQLQPSAFTSLGIVQENDVLYIKNTIYNRLEKQNRCCPPRKHQDDETTKWGKGYFKKNSLKNSQDECNNHKTLNLWVSALDGYTSQHSSSGEPGFLSNSPGAFIGLDSMIAGRSCIGGGFGYTHTHLHWRERRGNANTDTVYAALYGQWRAPRVFIQGSITGGYNMYSVHRKMSFGATSPIRATAKSSHKGAEGSLHFKSGLKYRAKRTEFVPFASLDYIFIHENNFREKGAQSLNLKVKSKNSDLLSSEVGLDVSHCFYNGGNSYTPFIRVSAIEETRFSGKHEKVTFVCGGSTMSVKGLNPSRTLGAAAAGFSALLFKDNDLSIFYQGKWGKRYNDNSFYLQYLRRF